MGTSVCLTPNQVNHLPLSFSASAPSKVESATRAFNELAVVIESWEQPATGKELELLKAVAHTMLEPPRGVRKLMESWHVFVALLRSDREQIFEFMTAWLRLRRAVLEVIERSNPEYERAKAEVIQDALENWRERPRTSAEGFREWLGKVSDSALR